MPTNQCFQSMGVAQEDKSGHIHIIISGQAGFITIISRTRTSHLGYCFSHFNNEVALGFLNTTFLTLNDADLTQPNLSSSIVDFRGLGSFLSLVSHLPRKYRQGSFLINEKILHSKMTYKIEGGVQIREAIHKEKCSFFEHCSNGGGGQPMFKNYVGNCRVFWRSFNNMKFA